MDNIYKEIGKAVKDIEIVIDEMYDDKSMKIITNEFVRWNDKNMFHDTGQSRKDVKTQSNYANGEVIGRNEYFEYAYEYNISGEIKPFEYTANERIGDLEDLQLNILDKKLK